MEEGWKALKTALEKKVEELEAVVKAKNEIIQQLQQQQSAPSSTTTSTSTTTTTTTIRKEEKETQSDFNVGSETEMKKELERLRQHVVEQEEGHTQQLIDLQSDCEKRELELKQLNITRTELEKCVQTLTARCEEWQAYASQRDSECGRLSIALSNLQSVLEQLQAEQEQIIAREMRPLHAELEHAKEEARNALKKAEHVQELENSVSSLERSLATLQRELSEKEANLSNFRSQVEPLQETLHQMGAQLENMTKAEESAVDKRLVKKLFVTFFARPAQRQELLELMGRILDFTEEEKEVLGLANSPIPPTPSQKLKSVAQKSLAQLWVEFLLRESSDISKPVPRKT